MDKKPQTNTPNQNITHITAIYGLISQVNEHIEAIQAETPFERGEKNNALEILNLWQKMELVALKEAFE